MAKLVNYFSTHGWLTGLVLAPFGVPDLGTLGCKKMTLAHPPSTQTP